MITVTLFDTVSKQALTDMIVVVCRDRDGRPWKAKGVAETTHRFEKFYDTTVEDEESLTWAGLLTAENIRAFCDGTVQAL